MRSGLDITIYLLYVERTGMRQAAKEFAKLIALLSLGGGLAVATGLGLFWFARETVMNDVSQYERNGFNTFFLGIGCCVVVGLIISGCTAVYARSLPLEENEE